MTTNANRRQFLTGLSTLIAAPAIIKVASIMPVKAMTSNEELWRGLWGENLRILYGAADVTPMEFTGFTPLFNMDAAARSVAEMLNTPDHWFRNVPIRIVGQLPAKEI